ncbi:AAA family ATPase [Actinomycetes bacterium KLBMP 9759]
MSSSGAVAEIEAERRYLVRARDSLTDYRDRIRAMAEQALRRGEDEQQIFWLTRRARQLEDPFDTPLFFGRLDGPESHPLYIGRRHVADFDDFPVVIDWRTDMAARFYRATATDPMEVTRRRRFGFAPDHTLTGFDDEVLTDAAAGTGLSAVVRETIEAAHYGPMRDIVATIQADQDHVVRAAADVCVAVQGGPGTGKTAVGLHRAAYLLYENKLVRERGALVVGPNEAFVHYISRVLPALGEVQTVHMSMAQLAGAQRGAPEDEAVATLKGDGRMATVLERAMWSIVRPWPEDLRITQTSPYVRVHREDLHELSADLVEQRMPFVQARALMRERVAARVRRTVEERGRTLTDAETAGIGRAKPVRAVVDGIWPPVKARDVLFRLWSEPEFLARCADGVLSGTEQKALLWDAPPPSATRARWSVFDHVLLDELAAHLEPPQAHGHVVLDEAQDLSAMQLRAVGRRCAATATLLGDLAQQTTAWGMPSWQDVLGVLGLPGDVVQLNTSYRVPAEILELANRLLDVIAPELPRTTSARTAAHAVALVPTADVVASAAEVVAAVPEEQGSVGVIVADVDLARLRRGLLAKGVETVAVDAVDRANRVALVAVSQVKGLEFDHVVLVEPARILAVGGIGVRHLYVALTRAISRLTVVHAEALPEMLGI